MTNWDAYRQSEGIHPDVWAASYEELIAAGWDWTPRAKIPAGWRSIKPERPNRGGIQKRHNTPEERRAARLAAIRKFEAKRPPRRRTVIPAAIARQRQYNRKRLAKADAA